MGTNAQFRVQNLDSFKKVFFRQSCFSLIITKDRVA